MVTGQEIVVSNQKGRISVKSSPETFVKKSTLWIFCWSLKEDLRLHSDLISLLDPLSYHKEEIKVFPVNDQGRISTSYVNFTNKGEIYQFERVMVLPDRCSPFRFV